MGLLDGLVGQVLGGALGGGTGQTNNPLGSILGSLAGSLGGAGNLGSGGGLGAMLGGALGAAGAGARSTGGALAGGAILAAVLQMVQQQGGIGALLGKLQSSGLGAHADSWTSTGANMPVTGDQLHQALGADALGGLAAKLGVNTQQAGGMLSQVLPELVNQLSPSGQLPANHNDLLSEGLQMLRGLGHH
ncbi:MAG: YidB family protein [Gammaproteobacteria bacterium]